MLFSIRVKVYVFILLSVVIVILTCKCTTVRLRGGQGWIAVIRRILVWSYATRSFCRTFEQLETGSAACADVTNLVLGLELGHRRRGVAAACVQPIVVAN